MLHIILRSLAFMAGTLAYLTCFMYKDEEGRWQSRIDNVWKAIHERAKLSGSKTSALFNTVAAVVTRGFDRFFGRSMFSFQFIGVSTSSSFSGMLLSMAFALLRVSFLVVGSAAAAPSKAAGEGAALLFLGLGCLIVGSICVLFAVMPSLWPSFLSVSLSLIPGALVVAGTVRLILIHHSLFDKDLGIFVALLVSLVSDMALLALVRFAVRLISTESSVYRIGLSVLMQLGVVVLLVLTPVKTALMLTKKIGDHYPPTSLAQFSFDVGSFNVFTAIVSCVFTGILLFVLLYRVFWPLLSRLVYQLVRNKIVSNRKIMAVIGTSGYLYAFPLMWRPLKSFLQWATK